MDYGAENGLMELMIHENICSSRIHYNLVRVDVRIDLKDLPFDVIREKIIPNPFVHLSLIIGIAIVILGLIFQFSSVAQTQNLNREKFFLLPSES